MAINQNEKERVKSEKEDEILTAILVASLSFKLEVIFKKINNDVKEFYIVNKIPLISQSYKEDIGSILRTEQNKLINSFYDRNSEIAEREAGTSKRGRDKKLYSIIKDNITADIYSRSPQKVDDIYNSIQYKIEKIYDKIYEKHITEASKKRGYIDYKEISNKAAEEFNKSITPLSKLYAENEVDKESEKSKLMEIIGLSAAGAIIGNTAFPKLGSNAASMLSSLPGGQALSNMAINVFNELKISPANIPGFAEKILKKQWRHIHPPDDRIRPGHIDAHGQTVEVNKPFIVKVIDYSGNILREEQLMHPRDKSLGATAANVSGCRCKVVYINNNDASFPTYERGEYLRD